MKILTSENKFLRKKSKRVASIVLSIGDAVIGK